MGNLQSLKFDNANNACQSLRILAEWVRTGDVVIAEEKLTASTIYPVPQLNLVAVEPRKVR